MKLRMLSMLAAAVVLVGGCDDDDNGTAPEATGQVRVVHLSPDAPNVDVLVDGATVATNVPYLTASDYLDVEAGSSTIEIRPAGSTTTVLDETVAVADGADYTVLVGDELASLAITPLTDDNTAPPAGSAKVRLIHGAPGAGVVDVYVTAPGADLATSTPALTAIDFGAVSPYLSVPAGDYQVRITPHGTLDVAIDSGTLPLASGQVRTGIAVDAPGGGAPFSAIVLEDLN